MISFQVNMPEIVKVRREVSTLKVSRPNRDEQTPDDDNGNIEDESEDVGRKKQNKKKHRCGDKEKRKHKSMRESLDSNSSYSSADPQRDKVSIPATEARQRSNVKLK